MITASKLLFVCNISANPFLSTGGGKETGGNSHVPGGGGEGGGGLWHALLLRTFNGVWEIKVNDFGGVGEEGWLKEGKEEGGGRHCVLRRGGGGERIEEEEVERKETERLLKKPS